MIRLDIDMPLGCIYEKNGKTEYCPLCNHYDVPFCQFLDDEAEIGIDERPCYCPLSAEPHTGEWLEYTANGTLEYMCSECGAKETNPKIANFCWHCGADMKMERE